MVIMNSNYIYVVGKSFAKGKIAEHIHAMGYKAGILADNQISHEGLDEFDRVEMIDFSNTQAELERLEKLDLQAAGLYCIYENYIVAKALLGKALSVPALSLEAAQKSTDKILMREAFLANAPSVTPQYSEITTVEEAVSFAQKHGYPVILKPANLVKSLLIIRCDSDEQLRKNFEYARSTIGKLYKEYGVREHNPRLLIEEFVTGLQYTVAALVDHEGTAHFCEGIVDITTAQDIGVNDTYLFCRSVPTQIYNEEKEALFEAARQGIRALGLRSSAAHVEIIYGKDGPKIVEIGARTGGYRPRMYKYAYGIDLIEQELMLSIGEVPNLNGTFSKYCAVYEFFPQAKGKFINIANCINSETVAYLNIKPKPGDLIGPARDGFKAAAIVIVTADERDEFDSLCNKAAKMKVEIEAV